MSFSIGLVATRPASQHSQKQTVARKLAAEAAITTSTFAIDAPNQVTIQVTANETLPLKRTLRASRTAWQNLEMKVPNASGNSDRLSRAQNQLTCWVCAASKAPR